MTKVLQARTILWFMVFTGFGVNYMVRTNINIVLVDMVNPRRSSGSTTLKSDCGNTNATLAELMGNQVVPLKPPTSEIDRDQRFDWNEREQNMVLGAYFWLHCVTQIPGGVLARKFGTKLVFGIGNGLPVFLAFLMPLAAHFGYGTLTALRLLQGLFSVSELFISKTKRMKGQDEMRYDYITEQFSPPPKNLSQLASIATASSLDEFINEAAAGGSVGAGLTFVFCGQVTQFFGWPAAFYSTAVIGSIWLLAWIFLVYDTPEKHPRISTKEREYIREALQGIVTTEKMAVPWVNILTSVSVWILIVAQWASVWALYTIQTQTPTYFRNVHGWGVGKIGIVSGVPHIARVAFGAAFSTYCDHLLRKGALSRTNVRKLATAVALVGQGILATAVALSGCDVWTASICIFAASALHGASSSGPLAAMVDLSPNFAGVVLGLSGFITVLPGFISPIVVGAITYQNQTVSAWGKVFGIMAGQLIICGLLYVAFGRTELQPWNSPQKSSKEQRSYVQNKPV